MNKLIILVFLLFISISIVPAQKKRVPSSKPIVFAVKNDGKMLEPIAYVEKGKLTAPASGSDEAGIISAFNKTYYKPKTPYRIIFGGVDSGTATVKTSIAASDCARNMAEITAVSSKAKLKGKVMALATNVPAAKPGSGVRRLPTAPERAEIETLVRAEFANKKAEGKIDYHNLTALDVDGDGNAEMVGSYWAETSPTSRALLFFIANKGADKNYSFGFSDYYTIKQEDVMSGEISSVDEGTLHELLLDVFDFDGDGVGEVFTYTQSFEGAGFEVYARKGGKWVQIFEGTNYHCAY